MGNVYYIEKFLSKIKEDDILKRISSDYIYKEDKNEDINIDLTNAVTEVLLKGMSSYNNKVFTEARKDFIKEDYQPFINPFRVIGWNFAAEYYMKELGKTNLELINTIQNKNRFHFYKTENEISIEDLSHLLYQLKKALE